MQTCFKYLIFSLDLSFEEGIADLEMYNSSLFLLRTTFGIFLLFTSSSGLSLEKPHAT